MLAPELEHRISSKNAPWIRTRTCSWESEAFIRLLIGHTRWVHACAISPDSSFVVSASADKTLKIWDIATGSERVTLRGHTDQVVACAISPDGSYVVSASGERYVEFARGGARSGENTLKISDAVSGAERATLTGHAMYVESCAVSPDGSFIVSTSEDGTTKIWDAATGRERFTLIGKEGESPRLRYQPRQHLYCLG